MVYLVGVIASYMLLSAGRAELPVWTAGVAPADATDDPGLDTPIGPRDARVSERD